MRSILRALLPLLVALPTLASCAVGVNPVSGARRAYAYTWQQEIRLGREADREIVEQFGVVDDAELAAYVVRVGEAVLAHSHLRREGALPEYRETAFTFRVLDTEVVNAFALPGGFVYVTRGLLAHLDSEAQLAVVLGHEVAHVAARHSSKDALKTGALMIGIAGASALGEELGGVAEVLAEAGGLGLQFLMLRHSRDDEEVVRVRRTAPFRDLVGDRTLPVGMDLGDLAIMNGFGADETVPAGHRLKLPR
jgi:predicted Zn-dependent protease